MEKKTVSDAQKRAVAKYERENYDKIMVRFPKGTKERILKTGAKSYNNYVLNCVLSSLDALEPSEDTNKKNLLEIQAEIEKKKAAQDARAAALAREKEEKEAREKEENTALYMSYIERLRDGAPISEDSEKEAARRDSLLKDRTL